jgi:hypothetical protein
MKMKYFAALAITALLFVSCKKELEPQDNSDTPKTAAATPTTPQPMPGTQQTIQAPQAMPGQPQVVQTPATPVKTAPGMNPPHGQPNHRCDIAVGAPLNSPKAATATAGKASATPAMTVTQTPVKTAPGMNPPHGQPGHRCDIGVGEPLSSAPKASTAKAVTAPTTSAPALLNPDSAPVKTE